MLKNATPESPKEESSAAVSENISENEDSNSAKEAIKVKLESSVCNSPHLKTDVSGLKDEYMACSESEEKSSVKNDSQSNDADLNSDKRVSIDQTIIKTEPTDTSVTSGETCVLPRKNEIKDTPDVLKEQSSSLVNRKSNDIFPLEARQTPPHHSSPDHTAQEQILSSHSIKFLSSSYSKDLKFSESEADLSTISGVINFMLDEVCIDTRTFSPKNEVPQDVSLLCEDLVDQVCKNIELERLSPHLIRSPSLTDQKVLTEPNEKETKSSTLVDENLDEPSKDESDHDQEHENEDDLHDKSESRPARGRGRGARGRSRGRGKGRGRGRGGYRNTSKSCPPKVNQETSNDNDPNPNADDESPSLKKQSTSRKKSRAKTRNNLIPELGVIENIERSPSPQPLKRSRRIQALQEKKSAELAEKVKKEQQMLVEMVKKMDKSRSQENSCDSFYKPNKKRSKKVRWRLFLPF